MSEVHVLPVGDQVAHEWEDCPCGPDWQFRPGGVVVVHHALDGRS